MAVPEIFDISRQNAPGHYSPSQTALLLLDYKALVIGRIGPKAEAAVKEAAKMRDWARSKGIVVLHALVDFTGTPPFDTTKEFDRLSELTTQVKREGGGEEPAELLQGDGDVEFNRRPGYISALQSDGIKKFLQEKGIKSLLLMGLSTGGCVLRTALDAAENEFVVTITRDGCADAKDDVHEFLFGKVFGRGDFVVTGREFRDGYDRLQH
ncbi:hypothetical protein M409DRAFT_21943 [Zasmidium cellare ATCC 36951]|uniref:Isochorismatase-like domain-containing protein n=1 Tax=Zasmidium cellare ATCC 36951 TaxID=1080233 RepID=A0A6A6CME5_ZASCE|nr:uncharacterized protein M409DRAFT_21943 [Zasmidium cellare ATCC 36951]KAF2167793.1 hypothetical protein M409DRAFT_21943 [Zasmidium cellare ATCC 36951]